MKCLAIIPARANSKRLPGKNLEDCGGQSLIKWTVDAVRKSKLRRSWTISTDCFVTKAWALDHGYPCHWRLEGAAGDVPIQMAIKGLIGSSDSTHVMLLQPTSPLRSSDDIDACLDILDSGCDSVASYVDIGKHQELLTTNGAIFACKREHAIRHLLRGPDHRVHLMPPDRSIDIDTREDMALADRLLRTLDTKQATI